MYRNNELKQNLNNYSSFNFAKVDFKQSITR